MELNLRELTGYQEHIADEKARIEKAKDMLDFYRLQAKQTREMIKLAKTHKTLRAFVKAMPDDHVNITPAPGLIYVDVTLDCMRASLYREVPDELGLILLETRPVNESLGSPILRTYRSEDKRIQFYITSEVR